ncbi:MAG TPA: protein kinase [Gemmatimonadales bacterium]|nr:protein kinase [Gemmatimonadales bacterium]
MTALAAGARLGPYEIQSALGAGGMGEVYKARDSRLDRTVAIKVLAASWVDSPEMKQRFDREAQTIASLNHPNICVLHDVGRQDGVDFLVMEYLEGETLASRLEKGPLGLDEALKAAMAIADALDKAHRRGVVHRDLKPANVMLTASGPKLLDFGLAKWTVLPTPGSGSGSVLQTRTDLSSAGTVLGTLQYMSPEQLEGNEADARTDIFAFGALVYEMVTGKRAFEGRSRVLLISAIATSHPEPLSKLQPSASPALDHVVSTCLAKDPADRWQTARDLLAELRWAADAGAGDQGDLAAGSTGWLTRPGLIRIGLAAAALLVVGFTVPALFALQRQQEPGETRYRVPIQLSAQADGLNIAGVFQGVLFRPASFAVSPDGRSLAFVARGNTGDPFFLYVRPVGAVTPLRLAGTDDASQPFWSADSRSIGFVAGAKLRKVDAKGGPPQEVASVADFSGGTWNREGVIVFGTSQGLFRVPAEGGTPERVTTVEKSETGHLWPRFLPDGRRFLYTVLSGESSGRALMAGSLDSADKTRVMPAESNAGYADEGYLVFARGNAVYAQPFDLDALTVSGEPTRIADDVMYDSANGRSHYSLSENGVLAYFFSRNAQSVGGGSQSDMGEWQYSWVNRTGQPLRSVGPWGAYRGVDVSPGVSPETTRVAVHRHDPKGGDIWILEPRGSETNLTFDASRHNSMPIWSPDGKEIVYASQQKGKWGLYKTLSSGSGTEQLLYESDLLKAPMSWSPDGKRIVFWVQDPKTAGDLWVLELDGKKEPTTFVNSQYNETHAQISPDGKWIAFTSNLRDNRNEIYVMPFPAGTGRWRVSEAGGDWPRWKGDSREIFFHAIGNFATPSVGVAGAFAGPLFSATVSAAGGVFEPGEPRQILGFPALNLAHTGGDYHNYAVSPDGERFLVPQYVQSAGGAGGQLGADLLSGLTVAVNWASSIER